MTKPDIASFYAAVFAPVVADYIAPSAGEKEVRQSAEEGLSDLLRLKAKEDPSVVYELMEQYTEDVQSLTGIKLSVKDRYASN